MARAARALAGRYIVGGTLHCRQNAQRAALRAAGQATSGKHDAHVRATRIHLTRCTYARCARGGLWLEQRLEIRTGRLVRARAVRAKCKCSLAGLTRRYTASSARRRKGYLAGLRAPLSSLRLSRSNKLSCCKQVEPGGTRQGLPCAHGPSLPYVREANERTTSWISRNVRQRRCSGVHANRGELLRRT